MTVINVMPLVRGGPKDDLTYFTAADIAPGAIVSVMIRGREVAALVVAAKPVDDLRSSLKQADFALKKIKRVRATSFFQPEFIAAAQVTADYFVAPLGAVLKSFIPQVMLNELNNQDD